MSDRDVDLVQLGGGWKPYVPGQFHLFPETELLLRVSAPFGGYCTVIGYYRTSTDELVTIWMSSGIRREYPVACIYAYRYR
jgi:hypothetical protein